MGIFSNIKNWIVNKWNVVTKFDPYFKKSNEKLDSLIFISEDIDSEIIKIYKTIKATDPQKYFKQINQFENAVSSIRKHNDKVTEIHKGMEGFDFDQIISAPLNFDITKLDSFIHTSNLIKTFKYYKLSYKAFIDRVDDIENYYHFIVTLFLVYVKLLVFKIRYIIFIS